MSHILFRRGASGFAIATLGFAVFAPQARAAEADALAISATIQAIHVPFGTVLDPIYAAPLSNQIIGYTRCGDSAIWTGHYLAAEAFRYQVTQSADAFHNVQQAIAGIKSLIDVTGTNLLARCMVPLNSPYAAGIRSEEAPNGIYINNSAGAFWVGNTSRDQYLGVIFGLGVAYDMVNDAGVQSTISQIASRLINFLTGHAWSIAMPDGSITTTFLIRPDQILTILQVGKHVNPGAFSSQYDAERILLANGVSAPIALDVASDSSYFKFNLDYISFYNLVRLETGFSKSAYQSAYAVLRGATVNDQNPMFDLIDRGLKGADATRDAEAAALTEQWLQRPIRDKPVNLQNTVTSCAGQACLPIPVVLRPADEYLWEESPYQIIGGGAGIIETAGIDYLLPYWMGRYYGVIPAIAVEPAGAPAAVIAPDSLATIYGDTLTPAGVQASSQPPMASLDGVTLTVADSAGTFRSALLLYVSPSRITFVVPSGTAPGTALCTISDASAVAVNTPATVQSIAPAIFSLSGDGRGVAAATAIRVPASSPQTQLPVAVFQCSATCQTAPIALNGNSTVYLSLYGTGIRNRSSLTNVTATINGVGLPVQYAGIQPTYAGLDQVNLVLPPSLSGSGEANIVLTVDGQTANVVAVNIQ